MEMNTCNERSQDSTAHQLVNPSHRLPWDVVWPPKVLAWPWAACSATCSLGRSCPAPLGGHPGFCTAPPAQEGVLGPSTQPGPGTHQGVGEGAPSPEEQGQKGATASLGLCWEPALLEHLSTESPTWSQVTTVVEETFYRALLCVGNSSWILVRAQAPLLQALLTHLPSVLGGCFATTCLVFCFLPSCTRVKLRNTHIFPHLFPLPSLPSDSPLHFSLSFFPSFYLKWDSDICHLHFGLFQTKCVRRASAEASGHRGKGRCPEGLRPCISAPQPPGKEVGPRRPCAQPALSMASVLLGSSQTLSVNKY